MQIEHELPECAFKPRQAFLQDDKSRAGQFGRTLEIHLAKRFAQIKMLFGLE
jgi:hypothetical protein